MGGGGERKRSERERERKRKGVFMQFSSYLTSQGTCTGQKGSKNENSNSLRELGVVPPATAPAIGAVAVADFDAATALQ